MIPADFFHIASHFSYGAARRSSMAWMNRWWSSVSSAGGIVVDVRKGIASSLSLARGKWKSWLWGEAGERNSCCALGDARRLHSTATSSTWPFSYSSSPKNCKALCHLARLPINPMKISDGQGAQGSYYHKLGFNRRLSEVVLFSCHTKPTSINKSQTCKMVPLNCPPKTIIPSLAASS